MSRDLGAGQLARIVDDRIRRIRIRQAFFHLKTLVMPSPEAQQSRRYVDNVMFHWIGQRGKRMRMQVQSTPQLSKCCHRRLDLKLEHDMFLSLSRYSDPFRLISQCLVSP